MKNLFIVLALVLFLFNPGAFGITVTVGAPGTAEGGGDPDYATLKEACDYFNATIQGDIISTDYIIITSDLTEPAGIVLSIPNAPSDGSLSVYIQPMEGRNPVITFTASGDPGLTETGLYIRALSVTTHLVGLTLQGDSSSAKNIIPVRIDGGNGYNTFGEISNCNIFYKSPLADSTLISCAVLMEGTDTYITDCYISTDFPFASPYASGILSNISSGDIRNCKVEAKNIGISFRGGDRGELIGNEVIMNQDVVNIPITGIIAAGFMRADVEENKVLLSKNNYSTASGATGIKIDDNCLCVNNMITGFYLDNNSVKPSSELIGLEMKNNDWAIAFNTIRMNDVSVVCNGNNPSYSGIKIGPGAYVENTFKSNIVVNEENDIPSFCILFEGERLHSDYNNLYTTGHLSYTGYFNGTPAVSLSNWQAITGQDSNSVAVEITFAGPDDLHLAGSSIGDNRLSGVPDSYAPMDIDGDTRSVEYPYMGADEAGVPLTARVISSVTDNFVPQKFELQQNYPNPFNPVTKIVFNIPNDAHVKLEITGITGEVVKVLLDEYRPAGSYTTYFTANNFASGTYIYRLTAGKEIVSRKMMLLK